MSGKTEPKTLDYYLSLNYRIAMYRDEEGDYIAEVEGLPGCVADGKTPTAAYENIYAAMRSWIASRLEAGLDICEPESGQGQEQYSGKLLLRIPKYLHRLVASQARTEGVSLNQYLLARLAEASAWTGIRRLPEVNSPDRAYQTNLESLVAARTDQLRKAHAALERSYDVTLEALGYVLDFKHAESEGHSKRVTAFTIAIARAMGLSADQIRVIARGAFLHNIGKMAIPDAILRKSGALAPEEMNIMREHCYRGYQMLKKIPFLTETAEIVYSQYERYDGTGYPRGLRGLGIPLGARILAIADVLETLTSEKPYRREELFSKAISEIVKSAGLQFDPHIVEVFAGLPRNIWHDLTLEIEKGNLTPSPTQVYIDDVCERIAVASNIRG